MKNEATETKSTLRVPGQFFKSVAFLGALLLSCASALAQNVFVSGNDASGGKIFEFTPNGIQTTFATGLNPAGLAFDNAGNLFVANVVYGSGNGQGSIYKFTPAGVRTTFASGLDYPLHLAFDSAGNLFVADFGAGRIYKITPGGVRTTFASFPAPEGLAFDMAGNLFVGSAGFIFKFSPSGVRSIFASGFVGDLDLAFDRAGNLFVSGSYGSGINVYKFTPGGAKTVFATGMFAPASLAFDSAGNLFVMDLGLTEAASTIYKFTPEGKGSTFAAGEPPSDPSLDFNSLIVQPSQTPTPALVNISARGSVEAGENALISGFIVTGSTEQPVITRALGPTLTSFGVPDVLQDPVLQLHNSTSIMMVNDNWQSATNASQIPIDYRPPDIRESAIMTTLPPGAYTTVLSGKNATTGNGLLEVYSTSSGLSNASIRGFVGTGDHVLIGGFSSSGGNGNIQLIIRALGPTLTQFGVNGALADPTLTLLDGNGNVVASNDNWKNTQQSIIQVTGFAPPNDLEPAIFATLPNGNYTAIVAGKNGTTGIGLLEIYKVALVTSSHDF